MERRRLGLCTGLLLKALPSRWQPLPYGPDWKGLAKFMESLAHVLRNGQRGGRKMSPHRGHQKW